MMMVANLVGFAIGLDGLKGLVYGILGSYSGMLDFRALNADKADCDCRSGVFRNCVCCSFCGSADHVRDEGAGVAAGDQVEMLRGNLAIPPSNIQNSIPITFYRAESWRAACK